MSGTGKINDFVPIGTSLVGEATFITKEMAKALNTQREIMERLQKRNKKLEKMAFHYIPEEWNTMLRKIERLQEQLDDANSILKNVFISSAYYKTKRAKYLEKWGVK